MKYFREYPWILQAVLFVLMIFTMISAASVILLSVVTKSTGFTYQQILGINEYSTQQLIAAATTAQGISSVLAFMAPAWVFAYLAHPRPAQYLGLRAPGKPIQWVLVLLVMLGAIPVLSFLMDLVGMINFGPKVKAEQMQNDTMMKAFLKMPDAASFVRALVVMAIIPALGEELFFRGIMLRLARKRTRNMVLPVVLTAIIFSFSHSNVYGYLSIFLAGALLAVIYQLTGSLWCSIVAHCAFNGTQVVLSYLGQGSPSGADEKTPWWLALAGLAVFAGAFYMLWKNRTPLRPDWYDDFHGEPAQQYTAD